MESLGSCGPEETVQCPALVDGILRMSSRTNAIEALWYAIRWAGVSLILIFVGGVVGNALLSAGLTVAKILQTAIYLAALLLAGIWWSDFRERQRSAFRLKPPLDEGKGSG